MYKITEFLRICMYICMHLKAQMFKIFHGSIACNKGLEVIYLFISRRKDKYITGYPSNMILHSYRKKWTSSAVVFKFQISGNKEQGLEGEVHVIFCEAKEKMSLCINFCLYVHKEIGSLYTKAYSFAYIKKEGVAWLWGEDFKINSFLKRLLNVLFLQGGACGCDIGEIWRLCRNKWAGRCS